MPRGGYRPGAGRPHGAKSKATIEREEKARLEMEAARDKSIATGAKLAKEVIEDFMQFAAGVATTYQPTKNNETADETKFLVWAKLAVGWATDLAPYQSPTYKAVAVTEVPPAPAIPVPSQIPDGTNVVPLMDEAAACEARQRMIRANPKVA